MKLITIIVVSIFSLSCFSQNQIVEIINPIPNGSDDYPTSHRIRKDHKRAGYIIYFKYENTDENEHGVCRSLGFEKAVLNSSTKSFWGIYPAVEVNEDGKVISLTSHKRRITKISCVNYINSPNEKVFYFRVPSYPGLPERRSICLSKNTREDKKYGDIACRKLGYAKSLYTQREGAHIDSSCMSVDENENYMQAFRSRAHTRNLVCIK